jgi:hypothetical protein
VSGNQSPLESATLNHPQFVDGHIFDGLDHNGFNEAVVPDAVGQVLNGLGGKEAATIELFVNEDVPHGDVIDSVHDVVMA